MKENQKIKIITTQYAEGDKETVIVETFADISGNTDDYTLSYIETQGDSAGEMTFIHVTNKSRVEIKREKGALASLIILENGIRHISNYSVSGVSFNMGMSCSEISSDFENGRLFFRYETDVELVPIGEIEFEFIFGKTGV